MKAAPTVAAQVASMKMSSRWVYVIATFVFCFFVLALAYYSPYFSDSPLIVHNSVNLKNLIMEESSEGDNTSASAMPSNSKTATTAKPRQPANLKDPSLVTSSSTAPVSNTTRNSQDSEEKSSSTQLPLTSSKPLQVRPVLAVDPKVWKFEPPTSDLATRPRGTMHPDSLNPERTYNTEPPNLSLCHSEGDKIVSIYWESHDRLVSFFTPPNLFPTGLTKCSMPEGVQCKLQNDDKLADAVFRFVYFIDAAGPLRYCQDQSLIIFNSEALRGVDGNYQQLDLADIRIDHFLTSDAYWKPVCFTFSNIYKGYPSNSVDPAKRTKAAALFMSNCDFQFRNIYIKEIMKYIHIDSYGGCFNNVQQQLQQSRFSSNRNGVVIQTLASYRMFITFENLIQEDYITEKIWTAYNGGVIPVYLGPPDIYNWVPGNHTFIDPRDFAGPKELAEYMKRVAEDDDLYRYHTSNFDWDRTKRMMDKYCQKSDLVCSMCRLAYEKKSQKLKTQ